MGIQRMMLKNLSLLASTLLTAYGFVVYLAYPFIADLFALVVAR